MERLKPSRGSQCRACQHRELAAIDLALARGVSVRAMSRRYGISIDSLYRHSNRHLPPQLRAKLIAGPSIEGLDAEKLMADEAQSLLMNLIALRNRLFSALDVAEECGDGSYVAKISSQLHRNLELTGECVGTLSTGSTTINNVLVLPAYVEMRVALVKALAPFPDARKAVAKVLHRIETKAAETIKQNAGQGFAHVTN